MKLHLTYCLTALFSCFVFGSTAKTISVSSAAQISAANPSPGDILLMSKTANWADQDIVLNFTGTAANPITLQAEGSGEVILSGGASLKIGGTYIVVDGLTFQNCASTEGNDLVEFQTSNEATYCRLTNCMFKNNNPTDLNVGYKWVSLHGENNRVDHCWFQEKKHRGTTLVVWLDLTDKPNYHKIDHNYFTRPLLSTGNNEAETIRVGDSQTSLVTSNTIVEYNFFEECDGEIESISNKSCYNVYRYNTFYNNASILTLRHGHYCTVDGNYFFGNNKSGAGGVRIIGVGHKIINNYMQDLAGSGNLRGPIIIMGGLEGLTVTDATNRYVAAENNTVAFNTIVNCTQSIYIGSDKAASGETYKAPLNNTIDNNIIYGGKDNAVKFEYGEIASFKYSGNLYFNMNLGTTSTGFTKVDPMFTFGTGFTPAHIKSTSPAIDAATGSYMLTEDFDGEARTGKYDVGCDEYKSTTPIRKPVVKTEVGPCWVNPAACSGVVTPVLDCKGVENGTAKIDNCGICSGGTTGVIANSSCTQDCNGDWKGSAKIDACKVCSGGNTGVAVDACLICEAVIATSNDGNLPANVLDKNVATRWSAQGVNEYLEFCFPTTQTLRNVAISFYKGNERATSFHVDISTDGVNWTRVLTSKTSSGISNDLEVFAFTAAQAKKMRVIGLGNTANDWNSITEVEWNRLITATNEFLSFEELSVYPNPTADVLNIIGLSQNSTWSIVNMQGQVLLTGNSSSANTSNLVNGLYFLELSTGQKIKFLK